MRRIRTFAIAAALGLAAPLLASTSATAAPPHFETITEPFGDHIADFCDIPGFDVDSSGIFHSRLKIRTTKSGIAYFLEHITTDETVTGVESGRSVSVHTTILSKDLKIIDNGDDTLTITQLLTGNSTMYNEDGKAIARNPGQVRFRLVIDTNGTPNDFDDDIELSRELIFGSTGRSDDYCAATFNEIG